MCRPQLTGAAEIIEYLFETYGPGKEKIPSSLRGTGGGGIFKSSKGANIRRNARPDSTRMKPITLYGWEGNSLVRPVRETLTELGLPHIFVNCAEGSSNK